MTSTLTVASFGLMLAGSTIWWGTGLGLLDEVGADSTTLEDVEACMP